MYLKTDPKHVSSKLISGHLRYNNTPGSLSNSQADGSISTFLPEKFNKAVSGKDQKCTPARSPEQGRLICNVYECEFFLSRCVLKTQRVTERNKWWQKAKGKLWVKLSSSCAECWLSKPSNSLVFVAAFVWSQADQQVKNKYNHISVKKKKKKVSCLMAQNSYNGNILSQIKLSSIQKIKVCTACTR